jgi:glycosyltransferase involved in cell wall biosynthesis
MGQNGKPTILMMSDCPILHTGQAVVLREIALGLHKTGKYNIVVAGWGYNGYPHPFPFPMLPASARDFGKGGFPEAGMPGIDQIIDNVKPDILWTVADIWMVNYIAELRNRNSFKWVAYTPVDGTPVPKYWEPWLKNADRIVCESKYGEDEMKKALPEFHTSFIHHGCNSSVYRPLSKEDKLKYREVINYAVVSGENNLSLQTGLPANDFIVGVVARNQPRKNFDKIIKAFSIFAKDKNDVKLWFHSAPKDQAYDIPQLATMYGLKGKVLFTPNYNIAHGLSEQDLNIVMNMFDVHILPTQGEGFGIPILETMAAGVPQIVTDYTSHVEFAKYGGELIPISIPDDMITGIPHPVERAIPKATEMAKLLEKLYRDPEHRANLAKGARDKAIGMTWDVTIPQWEEIISEVMGSKIKTSSPAIKILEI